MRGLPLFRTALCAGLLAIACGSSSNDGGSGNSAIGGTNSSGAGSGNGASGSGTSSAGSGTTPSGGSGNATAGSSSGGTGAVSGGANSGGASAGGASGGTSNAGASNGGSTSGAGTAGSGGTAPAGDLWIATNGSDSNPGTEALPILNLANAIARLTAGHGIFIKDGTYKYTNVISISKRGTATGTYTISAAPGAHPIIDFTGQALGTRGFDLQGDYWHIVGFEVENAGDNCIAISGSHNTIELMKIHGCQDTGLQITVSTADVADNTRGAYNTVLNCDSFENFDQATGGENADGFAAKLRIGPGNAFKGCRSYNNSDDGWDFFAADDVVTIDSSWAFSNGKGVNGNNPDGDGNGFKLGGKPTSTGEGGAVHLVTNSFGFENLACGFTQNSNPDVPKLTGCGARGNGEDDYCQTLSRSNTVAMTMTAAQAKAAARNADGSLPPMK
ncbi:MAG TPA: hypothetical protein VHV51_13860 [Polyangiaceae bacterium]|jgi:hypothetical protein|nr:hypothetical protein [Polyangiaceae bacterium]